MARTLTDVLSRRLRALTLNARAAVAMAPRVAQLMRAELGRDEAWATQQLRDFNTLAEAYLPCEYSAQNGV
jgi:glycerol-3-phosphate dehydrogenase